MARLLLVALTWPVVASSRDEDLLKGVSYGPSPLKEKGHLPNDDFMADSAKAQWSSSGRGDLAIMKQLGANAVRLYGNDPREDHKPFLDEAEKQGLGVIPGMSDYPYTQMEGNCMTTDFNCYSQIKEQYLSNLKNGFLDDHGAYHPALKYIIVINEPDLKIPGITSPVKFSRALVSAIDAMVDAEKEAGATGNLPNFTVTFSFGVCTACSGADGKPSVGQMLELRRAMQSPSDFGYTAQNDLASIYKTRFTNSFNTNNPAADMKPLFLDSYEANFPDVPVFIGEYHAPHVAVGEDLEKVLDVASKSPVLVGIAFFEFQVRYDKGGSEMGFGMFGLGSVKLSQMDYFGEPEDVWCLTEVIDAKSSNAVAKEVSTAFGGPGIDANQLCVIDPRKVQITEDGYQAVLALNDTAKMSIFVSRVVEHMGGKVSDESQLKAFAARYSSDNSLGSSHSLAAMAADLGSHPAWVQWDDYAACVADRTSEKGAVGKALGFACGKLTDFNCSKDFPDSCEQDFWLQADYAFSLYYLGLAASSPLRDCNFEGAALFATTESFRANDGVCVVTKDPSTTALSEQGYQLIIGQRDVDKVAVFITREVAALNMGVTDTSALRSLAAAPPKTLHDLQEQLRAAPWLCGGVTGRTCPGGGIGIGGWIGIVVAILVVILGLLGAWYMQRKRRLMQAREPLERLM